MVIIMTILREHGSVNGFSAVQGAGPNSGKMHNTSVLSSPVAENARARMSKADASRRAVGVPNPKHDKKP